MGSATRVVGDSTVDLGSIVHREATESDLPTIVSMLASDPLGTLRENPAQPNLSAYRDAFTAISSDPNHQLLVADSGGEIVAVLQLSFIPHLTYEGGWRAQIEGVRVSEQIRSRGVGQALLESAIRRAKSRGCHMVQLTTDRQREGALEFYLKLGFEATHQGLKLHLNRGTAE
jgi:GNAT superfamily N-acetyltransferase